MVLFFTRLWNYGSIFLPDCKTMILILPWLKAWFFFQPLWNLWFHFHQSFLTVLDPFEHHFFQFSASSFCSIFLHITHKTIFIDILERIILTNNITPRCVTLFVIQVSESCFAYFLFIIHFPRGMFDLRFWWPNWKNIKYLTDNLLILSILIFSIYSLFILFTVLKWSSTSIN